MTTITLTFRPNTFRWLQVSAFKMLTKERGHDSLTFVIDGAVTPFPNHPIHYTPLLMNDVARLVEGYATIEVKQSHGATDAPTGAQLGLMDMPQVSHYEKEYYNEISR